MLFALSTGHKVGLAVVAAVFISYSLVCALVLPRRNPNFPGKHLVPFLVVSVAMFLAMMAAVVIFGREAGTLNAEAAAPTTGTTATAPASTSTQPSGAAPSGNPAAGKAVFTSAGCVSCHTFTPAGSKGTIGPDLDKLADYAQKAGVPLPQYTHDAIVNPPPKYVPPGFPTNVMPTNFGKTLSSTQLNDLVAFLTQSP